MSSPSIRILGDPWPEAGRRGAQAGHSDGVGSVDSAGGDAGAAESMGPDVFRTQPRVSSWAISASGGAQGAAVHRSPG
jgi:hypothetical protein